MPIDRRLGSQMENRQICRVSIGQNLPLSIGTTTPNLDWTG